MKWEQLLSTQKLGTEMQTPELSDLFPVTAFEEDYNRIVSGAAFRRLQDKTQVFPLDKSDFVRTRLTHSVEVSTIARQLGIMIFKNPTELCPADARQYGDEIATALMCAGLLHDLGNPPFGHYGEATIGEWFRKHLDLIQYKNRPLRSWLTPQMVGDLEHFEGNAQALRMLLKARFGAEINLSKAIISALVKYPTSSVSFDRRHPDIKFHKPGVFLADEAAFRALSQEVGTAEEVIHRNPMTYVVEAADDIAYATADLEDAFKKGMFSLDVLIGFFRRYMESEAVRDLHETPYSVSLVQELETFRTELGNDASALHAWLVRARHWLMYAAVYRFLDSYEDIMAGRFTHDLFYRTNHFVTMKMLKRAMNEFVYYTPSVLKLELSSQTILPFLLDKFVNAVLYYGCHEQEDAFSSSITDRKYLAIFSESFLRHYEQARTGDEAYDLYLRLLMVTDNISGMTDNYARTLYRELSGIE